MVSKNKKRYAVDRGEDQEDWQISAEHFLELGG
jgi:hypothetical protein